MNSSKKQKRVKIIVIVGPNASGKSDYAVKLAKKINGEIISADSRQVYKGLNIGSGKITKKEMRCIPHHCLDIADPKKQFSAMDFKKCAERAISDILSRSKTPIIVGGTGFYIDAVLGRAKLGGAPPNLKLRKKLTKKTASELFELLNKLDQKRAKSIDAKNPVRLIRAIEILKAKDILRENLAQRGGASRAIREPANMRVFEKNYPLLKVLWIGIKHPPEELKKRICVRLIKRLPGIVREAKKLHNNGVTWKRLNDLGLEYRYTALYLQKKLSKDEFIRQLETAIWHYARRQMTWFKKNKEIRWISP